MGIKIFEDNKKAIKYIFIGALFVLLVANIVLFIYLLNIKYQITANVEIDSTFSVPIKTVVPIKTTVNVPVTIPILGQQVKVVVPIDTNVPINTTVQVPIKTTVPVNIKIGESPFGNNKK